METMPERNAALGEDDFDVQEISYEVVDVDANPYRAFDVDPSDLVPVEPLTTLLLEPEVAGYIVKAHGESARTWRRVRRAATGLLLALAVLVPAFMLPQWKMFARYAPVGLADTPKPQPYTGNVPLVFREAVREINAEIQAGNKWESVFEKLSAFAAAAAGAPADLRRWADGELLVAMASKELPPGAFGDDAPDAVFARFEEEGKAPGVPPPFRATAAYARVLHSRSSGREETAALDAKLLRVVERLRRDHPASMDRNRELLFIEAQRHAAALPSEYEPENRYTLDYHWRRVSHAIDRLYMQYGKKDAQVRALDRTRWEAVYRYFDFTVLTLDFNRMGRLSSIQLDGRTYTRDEIRKNLEEL